MSYLHQQQQFEPPPMPNNPPNSVRKPPPENKPSLLLSKDENQSIFDILGKGRQTLSTAVVQLLVPTPDQRQWTKKETGVVCFVRDQAKKSYFIQVLSLRTKSMVFRQEIYNQFEYQMPAQFFLTFEGDSTMVGINFADITEASNFREVLDNKLESKRQRRNERRSRILDHQNSQINTNHHVVSSAPSSQTSSSSVVSNGASSSITSNFHSNFTKFNNKGKGKKDKDKKKFRKEDISCPTNFRHVQHVGWDPNKGYDLEGVDKDLQSFFEKVGVSANDLKDHKTKQFIYNFIEKHGGVEAVKNSSKQFTNHDFNSSQGAPPVPARHPNQSTGTGKLAAPPPPPPSRPPESYLQHNNNNNNNSSNNNNNNNNSQSVPPPPPRNPSQSNRTPLPPFNNNNNSNNNTPMRPPLPPSMDQDTVDRSNFASAGPPPPPPPPLPCFDQSSGDGEMLQIKSNISGSGSSSSNNNNKKMHEPVTDDRSDLMKQIQSGIQLKKVSADPVAQKKPSASISDCLEAIKTGAKLKPVPEAAKTAVPTIDMDGLAGALARALAKRAEALNPSDSESSQNDEPDEDDDEWDE